MSAREDLEERSPNFHTPIYTLLILNFDISSGRNRCSKWSAPATTAVNNNQIDDSPAKLATHWNYLTHVGWHWQMQTTCLIYLVE